MPTNKAVTVVVRGWVQGVGYRWNAQREATRLGVAGSIHNEPDGTVVGVFEGPAAAVDAMVEWCRRGPAGARVSHVRVSSEAPTGRTGFSTR